MKAIMQLSAQLLVMLMILLPKNAFKSAGEKTGLALISEIIQSSNSITNELILSISEEKNLETEDEVYHHLIEAFNCLDPR